MLFRTLIFLITIGSCYPAARTSTTTRVQINSVPPAKDDASQQRSQQDFEASSTRATLPPVPELKTTQVHPNTLTIRQVTNSVASDGAKKAIILEFDASRNAEYISYSLCPRSVASSTACAPETLLAASELASPNPCDWETACVEGRLAGLVLKLPMLHQGTVGLSARACTAPERSSQNDNACGPEYTKEFNSDAADLTVKRLYLQLGAIKESLRQKIATYQDDIRAFIDEVTACDQLSAKAKQYLDNKVNAAKAATQISSDVLSGLTLGISNSDLIQSAVGAVQGEVRELAQTMCDKAADVIGDSSCMIGDIARNFAGFSSIVGLNGPLLDFMQSAISGDLGAMLDPAPTIAIATHTISDVIALQKGELAQTVPKTCNAEQNYAIRRETVIAEIHLLKTRYQEIQQQLKSAGYNTYVQTQEPFRR